MSLLLDKLHMKARKCFEGRSKKDRGIYVGEGSLGLKVIADKLNLREIANWLRFGQDIKSGTLFKYHRE